MSDSRWFHVGIAVFWLGSMTWLMTTKIVPLFRTGQLPNQGIILPESDSPIVERWLIRWNDQSIGTANVEMERTINGAVVRSDLEFGDLPVAQLLHELFGPASALLRATVGEVTAATVTLQLVSEMNLDLAGRLTSFDSTVCFGDIGQLFRLRGQVDETSLQLDLDAVGEFLPKGFPRQLYSNRFDLPRHAFVTDSMSPRSRLSNLHIGQKWTFNAYRPFPPNQPLQIVEASVETIDSIVWQAELQHVFVVVFRDRGGSGLSTADIPIGQLWVRSDGVVLRQELRIGDLKIRFLRQPDAG